MTIRRNISSPGAWEAQYGYSRAVRVGDVVEVSGTTAVDETGHVIGGNDMYAQARFVLEKIERALAEAGASLADVIRTRAYLTDFAHFDDLARAHSEVFAEHRPAATAIQAVLIRPDLLVEIEASAVVSIRPTEPERSDT